MEKRVTATKDKKTGRVISVKPVKNSEREYANELQRPLNYDIITNLAGKMFSNSEIAATLDMNRETFRRRLKVDETLRNCIDLGKELGKGNLRKSMYDRAVKDGNTVLLIWLSKNYLGMSDKQEIAIEDKKSTGVLLVPQQITPQAWAKKNSQGEVSEYDETPNTKVV